MVQRKRGSAMSDTAVEDLSAERVEDLVGVVNDADAHEMAPMHVWGDVFGPAAGLMSDVLAGFIEEQGNDPFGLYRPELRADDVEITSQSVWNIRGPGAPSAADFTRRLEVLDVMGIDKQLLFPSFAILASVMSTAAESFLRGKWGLTLPIEEIRALGRGAIADYNDWSARVTAMAPDRLRPVGYVVDDGSVADLLNQARDLVGRGIRAINIPAGTPPGGVSPADPALDPFWEFAASSDVPVLLHVGGDRGFMASTAWSAAPAFAPGKVGSAEIGVDPYSIATIQFAPSNFLTAMTLGGVFERFPNLRFGVIELGCTWFGPLSESLDMCARDVFAKRLAPYLSMRPSEYLARNVRVTPFNQFEPVERELERYPHLRSCYCFSSDYPHYEGGIDSKRMLYERLVSLGDDVLDGFFRRNAQLLLPD
jgi:predicted TIM-barrel fold metal-dependent hydrolase